MTIYFFDPVQDITDLELYKPFLSCLFNTHPKNGGRFPFCKDSGNKFRSEGPFRFLITGILGVTSGGGPLI